MAQEPRADRSITHDPIFYTTAAFFALLTTALPAILGQPRFLPVIQTLTLVTFITVALRHANVRGALRLFTLWLPIQYAAITLLTRAFGGQLEAAFSNGFVYRSEITTWFFAGAPFPHGLASEPITYLIEVAGIILGSLITAGVAGVWFLVRLLNLSAYGTGILLASLANPLQLLLVIPYWTLLRAAGYSGFIVLGAMPLLTSQWSPGYYWRQHRRLILISLALVAAGFVVELFLPGLVARPPLI
jgi:hypothetical protein